MSGFDRDFSLDDRAARGHEGRSRAKGDKHDRSKDALERKINFLQQRLDEERQASRREKLSLVRLQREMARQQSYPPSKDGLESDLQRAEMLRVESEQRLREMVVENDTCNGRLRGLQEEFKKMEGVVQNMTQYKAKLDQLKQEKSSLAVTYECNLQKYRTQMNTLERENILLLNEVKKKESQSSCLNDHRDKSKLLMERLKMLEAENSSLVLENEQQRQQYEKCLDEITNQVVHALLGQKSLREECLKLQDRVQDLELQNQQLSLMFQHKLQFSSEPMLQSYPSPRSPQTIGGFLANQTTASTSVTSLPTQTSSWNKSFPVRQKGFLQVPNLLKRPQSNPPKSSIAFLRDSIDSLQNMNNEHIYEEIHTHSIPQIGSPPMWSQNQLGFSRSSLGSGSRKQNSCSNGHSERTSSRHSLGSPFDSSNVSTPVSTPVSAEHRFRMKIETEFPATSNSSPKMKHVGIVSCGPEEMNGVFSSANQSRASSLSALSMTSSTNQNLSNHLNSDRLYIKLPFNREEGVKSPGWEWVSPTQSHHDKAPFLSPIDDFSDDESVKLSHGFSSASTVSLNEILDDSLGVEVEESEMECSSSMENLAIPAPNSSVFFSTKSGVNSFSGIASIVQTSSPDSDSGVHTPCITSPVRIDEKTTPGPTTTPAKTTSNTVVSSVYIPMQMKVTSPGPERPQSLELKKNGSTSSRSKSRTQSRSIIPKRVDSVSSSLPLAKSKLENHSMKSSKCKGGSSNGLSSNSSSKTGGQTGNFVAPSAKNATKSLASKSGKVSALPRKISNFSAKRPPPDVLPLSATSTPTESSKKKYKLPERNRTVVIASAMDDPPNISKAIDYLTDNSTYVPGIDTPTVSHHPDSFDALCGSPYPYKHPSISSDSSSENIRVERSGSKDDGYSTMSSDVHPDISDRCSEGTVKRNTILKQDSIEHPSLSPTLSLELKSPSPGIVKTPAKSTTKVLQMPILVKSTTTVKSIPPHPPPKPTNKPTTPTTPTTPTRRNSKLPVPKSLSIPPETKSKPTKCQKSSPVVSPTRNRVREMAKMFENNSVVDKQFLSQKNNRYSFHGDFSYFSRPKRSEEQAKTFRHSFDGSSVCIIPMGKCIASTEISILSSEKSIISSEKSVVENALSTNIGAITSQSTNISTSAKTESRKKSQDHKMCPSQIRKTCVTSVASPENTPEELKYFVNGDIKVNSESKVENRNSLECVKAENKNEYSNNLADAIVTDLSSKNLLCAALAEEFSSPDSISPVSDSSQDSLSQVKAYESDSVEQYLMHAEQNTDLSALCGAGRRDLRILHDITEESDASQTSTCDKLFKRKLVSRKSAIKETQNIPKRRPKLYKSKSDSELYIRCKITDSWLGPNSQPKGMTVSVCAIERSTSLGLVAMEPVPLSSMPQSLRRSPCQQLVEEDTMSQKATKLLHREHFSGDVYNYSSDSESDFEETINFASLWQQRPMATRGLPDWNPKETMASACKSSSNFSMNHHDLKSSSDIEEWLLQFSDKDIEEHLYGHGDSNFILQKEGSQNSISHAFGSDFGGESREESAPECTDVTLVTEEESGIVNDTRFRLEFYSLCRIESNKSLFSGNSSMGSDLDLCNMTSANENVGTPLENCVQDLCSNPSLATGHSNEEMAEFEKISRKIAALSQTVDDLNRSLSSIDSVDGSSEDIRLDDFKDFKPSNTEESSDGFHWVEDDEFYLAPYSGELIVYDSSLAAENGCHTSDWMNEYVQSQYQQQDEDFHHHLQDFPDETYSNSRISDNHGNNMASCEDIIAGDAETRAALLDRMLDFQESENSQSESDDENLFFENSQKNGARYLRKENKRKGKLEVLKPAVVKQRPVVDFTTFFNRYDEPEQVAVSAFNFLDNFSTSSSEEDQSDNSFDQSEMFQTDQVLPSSGMISTAASSRGATGPAFSTHKSRIPTSCEHIKTSRGKTHSRTAKVLKQAANLAERFSSSSLESQENITTESLTFSNSCSEGFGPNLNVDKLSVL